ncbi:hypothetical protein AAMO2058_000621700 [Amorphochlora amoebiformis]
MGRKGNLVAGLIASGMIFAAVRFLTPSASLSHAMSATQSRCSRSVSRLRRATSLLKGVGVAAGVGLAGLPIGSALSSRSLAAHAEASGGEKDILVIGCGTLGERVARAWKTSYPDAKVVGETKGDSRHTSFQQHGITPRLADSKEALSGEEKFPYVVFSAPPSASSDYVGAVKRAVDLWDKNGMIVFTSSGGSYLEEDGGVVVEDSPTKDPASSPRVKMLLDSENEIVKAGGCVVRLAGLYTLQRGAHSYWLQRGQVSGSPEGLINLIHYDDAADLVVAALKAGSASKGQVFLGVDDRPISRQEICEAAMRHPSYEAKFQMPTFTGMTGSLGKRYDNTMTRQTLGWIPKYPSFDSFIDESRSK